MRGTHSNCATSRGTWGIIPAYAGNTWNRPPVKTVRRDHPRVCGEHYDGAASTIRPLGSSPRMRGTLRPQGRDAAGPGIIPAYAGNTALLNEMILSEEDHPRVCGEHPKEHIGADMQKGSSPRMRGTPGGEASEESDRGIIPAYAGNTLRLHVRALRRRDHPRVCGEHLFVHVGKLHGLGSSPRMRGTP